VLGCDLRPFLELNGSSAERLVMKLLYIAASMAPVYVGDVLNGNMALHLMSLLLALKLLAVTTSYSSGNAGGIFGPSLFIGVRRFGSLLNNGEPKSRHRSHSPSSTSGDQLPAKSLETETEQPRENPRCLRIFRVSP
jgi:hypothetical protein